MKYLHMNERHEPFEEKTEASLLRIGMFANINRVTIKTLRYYEEQGLLKPAFVDRENGYRYYEAGQGYELHRIRALKNMGFSMEEIKRITEGEDEKKLLNKKKQEILRELAALTAKLTEVETYLAEEEMNILSPVLIKKIPEVTVCTMKRRIASYDMLFDVMPEMGEEMERLGCICAVPEYCFTYYPEPGYEEEDILIETCEAVTEMKENTEKVKFRVMDEVPEAACIYHRGSYDSLSISYEAVLKFIEENGYEICGCIRESYIDGIWNREKEEDWLTEIQIPVRKCKGI